jgi:predicted O-methyltransferase YrrM
VSSETVPENNREATPSGAPTPPAPSGPGFDDVYAGVADVQGWMTPAQARLLWDSARALRPGDRVVEIGSYQGRSTVILASAVPEDATVTAIDPHAGTDRGPQEISGKETEAEQDSRIFQENLERAGIRDRVTYLRHWSQDALAEVDGRIDLLYIDGAHRYRPAKMDIDTWSERVAPGGVLLIHDSFSSIGVTGAILTSLAFSSQWRYVGRAQSMTRYRRESLTTRDRATSTGRQLAQLPWFARNMLFKALISAHLKRVAVALGADPTQDWPY